MTILTVLATLAAQFYSISVPKIQSRPNSTRTSLQALDRVQYTKVEHIWVQCSLIGFNYEMYQLGKYSIKA